MAVNAFPLDPASGAPQYSAQQVRQALAALVGAFPSGRPLGARSGVRPGTPTNTITVSGVTVTVRPHAGIVDLETAAAAGPYFYWVNANTTVTLGAASGSGDRIDLISLVTNDPTQDATSTPGAVFVPTQGTPGAGVPGTPAGAFTIARINVPQAGTGSSSVTWVAPVAVAAGGVTPVGSSTERDALTAYLGQVVARTDTGVLERYTSSGWQGSVTAHVTAVNTTTPAFPDATETVVTGWVGSADDTGFTYSGGTWTYAGERAIRASVVGQLAWVGFTTATGQRVARLYVNSTRVHEFADEPDNNITRMTPFGWSGTLHPGDTVSVRAYQSQGATIGTTAGLDPATGKNHVSIDRIGDV